MGDGLAAQVLGPKCDPSPGVKMLHMVVLICEPSTGRQGEPLVLPNQQTLTCEGSCEDQNRWSLGNTTQS